MDQRRLSVSSLVVKTIGSLKRRYSEEDETRRLEKVLAIENARRRPKSKVNRIRHKGGLLLHSKQVLLAVVLLNLVDCALVLGELILDIHYIKGLVEKMDDESTNFIDKMEQKYPDYLRDNDVDNLNRLYQQVIDASCIFPTYNDDRLNTKEDFYTSTFHEVSTETTTEAGFFRSRRLFEESPSLNDGTENLADSETKDTDHARLHKEPHAHSIWEDVAHGLHKASITILGILFLENIMKVIFMGKEFLEHKLEVFDFFIVTSSFVLDLVFLKGLTVYRIQDGILILSFLVPWRVIRVVNSLIVAVLDHEHFRLKMMYKRQKTMSAELKDKKNLEKDLQLHLKKVERFCLNEGIAQWKVSQHIHFRRKASAISSMASYALGSMLSGDIIGDYNLMSGKSETNTSGGEKYKILTSCQSLDSGRGSIIEDPESSTSKDDDDTSSQSSNGIIHSKEESPNIDVEKGDNKSSNAHSDHNNSSFQTRL